MAPETFDEPRHPAPATRVELAGELSDIIDRLCAVASGPKSLLQRSANAKEHPSAATVGAIVESLRSVLFPGYFGIHEVSRQSLQFHMGALLDKALRPLEEQIRRALCFACDQPPSDERCEGCDQRASDAVRDFMQRLPDVRRLLGTDVGAAYEGDPAATSVDETIFCYPGVLAITNHRLAHELYKLGVPLIPRIISELAHSQTGIDIHPGARIGASFFIDHGTGVVIGETALLGERVRIYQGVTLGAKSFPLDADGNPIKGIPRHPLVEDDVCIYAGATILGRVTIGRGAVIGGNVWLTRSVAAGARVTQALPRQEMFEGGAGI